MDGFSILRTRRSSALEHVWREDTFLTGRALRSSAAAAVLLELRANFSKSRQGLSGAAPEDVRTPPRRHPRMCLSYGASNSLHASSYKDAAPQVLAEGVRFMESPHAIICAHWDHEPGWATSGAAVPAVFAGVSPAPNPGARRPGGRRDACPTTARFMEREPSFAFARALGP